VNKTLFSPVSLIYPSTLFDEMLLNFPILFFILPFEFFDTCDTPFRKKDLIFLNIHSLSPSVYQGPEFAREISWRLLEMKLDFFR